MPFPFDVKEMEFKNFRDAGNGKTKRAVEIENSSQNPVPVSITEQQGNFFQYNEVNSVAGNQVAGLFSYSVPSQSKLSLIRVFVSGDNKAIFEGKKNGQTIFKIRTWYGSFNGKIFLSGETFDEGDTLLVSVENKSNSSSDFNITISGALNES
jgi:hypothetical protein